MWKTVKWSVAQVMLACLLLLGAGVEPAAAQDIEVGDVRWGRDLEQAFAKSRQSGKPVFLFFQEVPGCIGCQNFGSTVLTHQLLVEAIEELFHPVLVYNNRLGGQDAELLARFGEPAWNFQVIRFLDGKGNELIPRKDQVDTIGALSERMIASLAAAGRFVPLFLQTLVYEGVTEQLPVALLTTHCFWVGEYALGAIDGVVATEAGWYEGREVTLVRYDPNRLSAEGLLAQAAAAGVAELAHLPVTEVVTVSGVQVRPLSMAKYSIAPESDQKRQLLSEPYYFQLPAVNTMQLSKINSLYPDNPEAAQTWLSPRQLAALRQLQ